MRPASARSSRPPRRPAPRRASPRSARRASCARPRCALAPAPRARRAPRRRAPRRRPRARAPPPPPRADPRPAAASRSTPQARRASFHQALGGGATRQHAARPRPVQVVASAGRVHVERLAHHVQTRHRCAPRTCADRTPPRANPPRCTWHCRASPTPRTSSASPLSARTSAGTSRCASGSLGVQPGRLQHGAPHRRQRHAAQRVVARARASALAQAREAGAQQLLERRLAVLRQQVDAQRVARLGEPRQVEHRDARHPVVAEQHLAPLARLGRAVPPDER